MNSNGDCLQWRRLILIKVLTVLMAPEAFAFPMAGEKMAKHSQPGFPRHANNSRSYNDADSLSSTPRQRRRQIRRKSVDRQPRFYWTDPENLRLEIFLFWRNCGVFVEPTTVPEASSSHHDNHTSATQLPPPTIPNEIFLMHYERHDLRGAIVKNGGRECVSKLLGGAPIMPGRWSSATTPSSLSLCPELKELLRLDPSLSIERPPRVRTSSAVAPKEEGTGRRWLHQNDRNRMGYWSLQTVIQELYERTVSRIDMFDCLVIFQTSYLSTSLLSTILRCSLPYHLDIDMSTWTPARNSSNDRRSGCRAPAKWQRMVETTCVRP